MRHKDAETLTASGDGVSDVSFDTLADAAMAGRSTVSIRATGPLYTRIGASIVAQLAVLRVGALIIYGALQDRDAHSVGAHLKVRRTDAALAVGGEDQASGTVAEALVADQDEAQLCFAADTHTFCISVVARRTHTLLVFIQDQSQARWTGGHGRALDGSVALVASDAHTHHGSDRQGVQHLALGVPAARVGD